MRGKTIALAGGFLLAGFLEAQLPPRFVPPRLQEQRLIHRVRPVYPRLARQARIQGTVRLAALIDERGIIERLVLIGGHPLLVNAAFDAVKQWRYRPAYWNGMSVPVVTTVEIRFTLDPRPRGGGNPGGTLHA